QSTLDQGLWSDEDVESFDEIGLEPLPRPVGDLQPDEVLGAVAEPAEDGGREGASKHGPDFKLRNHGRAASRARWTAAAGHARAARAPERFRRRAYSRADRSLRRRRRRARGPARRRRQELLRRRRRG